MSYEFLTVAKEDGVAIVTMNRPPVNALSPELTGEIDRLIGELQADHEVRAVLFRSAIDGFFMAGADIKRFEFAQEGPVDREALVQMVQRTQGVFNRLENLPKPTVAAINGHCLGGGLELALAIDFRIMADDDRATIGLPEVRLGLLPGAGGTQRLPRIVGKARALDLIARGRQLKAREAEAIGLVHQVVPPDQLDAESLKFAKSLARGATFAIGQIKRAIHQGSVLPLEEGLRIEAEGFVNCALSQDAKEGVRAFLEGRKPQFQGK